VFREEDSERNEVMRELQIPHVTEFIEYRKICKEHFERMSSEIPKKDLKLSTKIERRPQRPLQRWKDSVW
jgi:hypothetical protein